MDKKAFLDLFPNVSISTSMKELTPYLPIYGVAEISGIDVLSFHKLASMDEAESIAANFHALTQLNNDVQDFNTEDDTNNSVKKQLNFDTSNQSPNTSQDQQSISDDQIDEDTALKALDDTDEYSFSLF